ncbi:MAG: HAMP domain-containing sensor histidine kinase [Niameybacter sp.]
MLIIITILMTLVCIYVVLVKRDSTSLLLCALCVSFIVMFVGIIIYISKSGGFSQMQRFYLFLIPKIQMELQYLPVSLDSLGYMVAVGRFTFPIILLTIAINYSMEPVVRRRIKWTKCLLIPTAFWLIFYYPDIFRQVVKGKYVLQVFMIKVGFLWIILCLSAAISLMIREYISITIPFCKRNFKYIMLSYFSMTILYGLYCIQDPAQIYQTYGADYMWIKGISYTTSAMSTLGWVGLTLCGVFFVILGSFSLVGYTQIRTFDEKSDISLKRKFDATNMGATVFVHSIKNQLLSNRVMNKKIGLELAKENPDLDQLRVDCQRVNGLNEGMIDRMEELYNSIKNNSIYLVPMSVKNPIEDAIDKFSEKYPEQEIIVHLKTEETVLADEVHLREAIYNLLANAYEAAAEVEEQKARVELITHSERLYTVIEIRDNGHGLSKEKQNKIFDPFFTSKNTNYNWGMGLYYVKKIVSGHFGTLRIESEENKGTTIFVLLPKFSKNN